MDTLTVAQLNAHDIPTAYYTMAFHGYTDIIPLKCLRYLRITIMVFSVVNRYDVLILLQVFNWNTCA